MSSISFLYPSVLWGLGLLSIPIIIHLFSFRNYKTVQFSDVSLLISINKTGKAKKKLKHWLVLLFRCLAIFFLVLAFAQPVENNNNNLSAKGTLVSIYIDNSFSMSRIGEEGELLAQAKNIADKLINSYGENTRFQIISNNFKTQDQFIQIKENAQNLVAEIQPISKIKNFKEIINRQSVLLNKQADLKSIVYWISDFQELPKSLKLLDKSNFQVNLIPLKSFFKTNVSIDSVWFESPIRKISGRDKIGVRIFNQGEKNIKNFPVQLSINEKIQLGTVDLKSESYVDYSFDYQVPDSQLVKGVIKIDDAPIKFDNEFYFSYLIPKKIKILCISENIELISILTKIYQTDSIFEFKSVAPLSVNFSRINENQLLILGEMNEIEISLAEKIKQYINQKKGNVLLLPAYDIDVNSYQNFANELADFSVAKIDSSKKELQPIDVNSYFFAGIFDNNSSQEKLRIMMPSTFKRLEYNFKNGNVNVLLRTSNETPYLQKHNNIFLMSSGITKQCSNWAKHSLIVPVFYQFAFNSIINENEFLIENKNKFVRFKELWPKSIKIKKNDGVEFSPRLTKIGSENFIQIDENFNKQGFYTVLNENLKIDELSYNYSREEVKTVNKIEKYFDELKLKFSNAKILNSNSDEIETHVNQQINGVDYWKECLILAFIFLILEMATIKLFTNHLKN